MSNFTHKKSPLAGSGGLGYNNNYYIGLYMSNENRLGNFPFPSRDIDIKLKCSSRQEGKKLFPNILRILDRFTKGGLSEFIYNIDTFLHGESGRERFSISLAVCSATAIGVTNAGLATPIAYAQELKKLDPATKCLLGQKMEYVHGNAELKKLLGDKMGNPLTCEHADPKGTGDVHIATTTGLGYWRKSTNTPIFTNGFEHWAITADGLDYWTEISIDPPSNARPANSEPGIMADKGEAGKYPADQQEPEAVEPAIIAGMPGGGEAGVYFTSEQAVKELTPHQKVVNNLKEFYKSLNNTSAFTSWNPDEIEAFTNNPNQRIFTTFRMLPDPKGEPALFLLTGGKSGLSPTLGNIATIEEAIRLINLLDPTMIPLLTSDEYGFKGISSLYSGSMPEAASTYDPRRGMVEINEVDYPKVRHLPGRMMAILLAEARVNHTLKNSVVKDGRTILLGEDKLDDNPGLDKCKWAEAWGKKYQHLFGEWRDGRFGTYNWGDFMSTIEAGFKYYASRWP